MRGDEDNSHAALSLVSHDYWVMLCAERTGAKALEYGERRRCLAWLVSEGMRRGWV